jgi:hypothetical protein
LRTGSAFLNAELLPQLVKGVSRFTARGLALAAANAALKPTDGIAEALYGVLRTWIV